MTERQTCLFSESGHIKGLIVFGLPLKITCLLLHFSLWFELPFPFPDNNWDIYKYINFSKTLAFAEMVRSEGHQLQCRHSVDWDPLCLGFRKRTLSGQERAWYHWHCSLSQHLRVFDYLCSNLHSDDPHYLTGTQVRHIFRQIKCTSWRSHTQGHRMWRGRKRVLDYNGPSVHLLVQRRASLLHTVLSPTVCMEINISEIFICIIYGFLMIHMFILTVNQWVIATWFLT